MLRLLAPRIAGSLGQFSKRTQPLFCRSLSASHGPPDVKVGPDGECRLVFTPGSTEEKLFTGMDEFKELEEKFNEGKFDESSEEGAKLKKEMDDKWKDIDYHKSLLDREKSDIPETHEYQNWGRGSDNMFNRVGSMFWEFGTELKGWVKNKFVRDETPRRREFTPEEYNHPGYAASTLEDHYMEKTGKELFEEGPIELPWGTVEKPALIPSYHPHRIVGCVGGLDKEHGLRWFILKEGRKSMCWMCGQVFKLDRRHAPEGVLPIGDERNTPTGWQEEHAKNHGREVQTL